MNGARGNPRRRPTKPGSTRAPASEGGDETQPRGRRRAVSASVGNQAGESQAESQTVGNRTVGNQSVDVTRDSGRRVADRGLMDDAPTQTMRPVQTAAPTQVTGSAALRAVTVKPPAVGSAGARTTPAQQDEANGPALLLWPEPDSSTLELLDERG